MRARPAVPGPAQTDFETRRKQLIPAIREAKADAFLVTALPNVRYLSGFTGSNGALLVTPDRSLLFTDPRYEIQAAQESDCEVRVGKGPLVTEAVKSIKRDRLRAVAIERDRMALAEYRTLNEALTGVRLREPSGA